MPHYHDPPLVPGTGESPAERLARATSLAGSPGAAYLERRGVPLEVAAAAGVRFDADLAGRAALLVALQDGSGRTVALHGRYLQVVRGENKMLTVGAAGGVVQVLDGWQAEPLILVEGLFDALSLAACGWSCLATVGRWTPWLPEISRGRVAWLAFDAGRPGEAEAARCATLLSGSETRRLAPPSLCKDWNTALVKRWPGAVTRWLRACIPARDGEA